MIVTKVQKHRKQNQVAVPRAIPVIRTVPAIELTDGRVSHEQIRACAYQIYESRGSEPGQDIQDWLHAEAQIQGR